MDSTNWHKNNFDRGPYRYGFKTWLKAFQSLEQKYATTTVTDKVYRSSSDIASIGEMKYLSIL